jgi:hypothetical protein
MALVVGLIACAPPAGREAETEPTAIGPPCTTSLNEIDKAVCPRLHATRCVAASLASPAELCRRLHVDLVGTVPTPAQIESTCAGKDARAIATALMATPDYVRQSQELWGEVLAYDPTQLHGKWLADADLLVAKLVRGEMPYDTFAKRILGHPLFGVGGRLPRSDLPADDDRYFPQVARLAVKVFLGRSTIAGEDVALGNLFRFWKKQNVITNVDYGRTDPVLDPLACPCQTSAFGVTTRIELPLPGRALYDNVAYDMAPELRAELDKVGALFVTQDSFWTQGVDLALHMYLGWWKDTRNQDESLLAEVQMALAAWLRASPTHSWRELVLEVVTSDLYLRSNHVAEGAGDDINVWCTGPMRLMRPEAYVASLGKVLDVGVGRCDHRTREERGRPRYPNGSDASFFPEDLRADQSSNAELLGSADYHYLAATSMGGCTGGAARSEAPTLRLVFGAAPVAQTLCAASRAIVPPGVAPGDTSPVAVQKIADHLSLLLRGRASTGPEREATKGDAARCASRTNCDARAIAVDMCAAIARSNDAMTY